MRGLFAIVFLIAGITGMVYGAAQLTGVVDGSGVALLAGGAMAAAIGATVVRRISASPSDATVQNQSGFGDHSLTEHHSGQLPQSTASEPVSSEASRGTPKVAIVAAVLLVISGGVAAFLATAQPDPPNVAAHILTACQEALRQAEGPAASFGRVVEYESAGLGLQKVSFETTQGWTWACTYTTDTGDAVASPVNRG